jgi:Right handed beta helix region
MSTASCARAAAAWATPHAHAVPLTSAGCTGGAGTIYAVPPGTHSGWALIPKAGDTILGLGPATVLDGGSRNVFDGVTAVGSPIVHSASAPFVSGDGAGTTYLTDGWGTFSNSLILSYQSPTQVTMSSNATGTFTGLPFAIGAQRYAIYDGYGTVANVTVRNLTVRNYTASPFAGTIWPTLAASTGWALVNLTVSGSGWSGTQLDQASVYGGRYHHNNVLGISSGFATTTTTTLLGVELDHNGAASIVADASGGFKWTYGKATVTSCFAHDNFGPGFWSDVDATATTMFDCDAWDNTDSGIFLEISFGPISVTYNRCLRNGLGLSWYWGAGITLAAAGGLDSGHQADIGHNTSTGNLNGIVGIQQARGAGTLGPRLLQHINVHDNTITGTGLVGCIADLGTTPDPALVVASPAPTTTAFSVTAGQGSAYQIGMWVRMRGGVVQITGIATDRLTTTTMSTAPISGDSVPVALTSSDIHWTNNALTGGVAYVTTYGTGFGS